MAGPDDKNLFPKWRLIPRVADIGFFQGAVKTRARLMIAAGATTAAEFGIIYVVSDWMRERSGSAVANGLIIGLMLTGLIIASYFVALLVGDLFFPGRWRERVVLGMEFEAETWEEERASVKEYNAHFFVIFIVVLLSLAWVSQRMTDGFLSWYQNLGFALTLMRSDDPADRMMGLEEMANPLHEEYWGNQDLHEQLAVLMGDDDDEVLAKACYVAGRLNVVKSGDPMIEVFRESDNADVRAEAATALGRLQWQRAVGHMASRLKAKGIEDVESIGILRGFAFMEDKRGGGSVTARLQTCVDGGERPSKDVVVNGFYALRKMTYDSGSETALAWIGGACEATAAERCAAADALRFIATNDDIPALKRAFDATPSDFECDYEMWKYHEEKAIEIVEPEPLRAKIVRAVGNQKNNDTYEWIWQIGSNEAEHLTTRKIAEIYTREMYKAHQRENPN